MAGLPGARAARVILTYRMILTYIEKQAFCLGQELKGSSSTPGGIWQCLETSELQLVGGQVLLVSGEERPKVLLNIPASLGQPTAKNSPLQNVNSAEVDKFCSQV